MTWRYQPVWVGDEGARDFYLVSVDLSDDGSLEHWSDTGDCPGHGLSIHELTADLARMLMDANLYRPVAFSSLKAGMVFERVGE